MASGAMVSAGSGGGAGTSYRRNEIDRGGLYLAVTNRKSAPTNRDPAWSGFEAEVLPHVDPLFRLAMWFERDRAEAEDLVQETLKQALESFHRYTVGTNCRAWLISILRHLRNNRRRAKGRSPLVDDPDDRLAGTVAFTPPIPDRLTDEEILAALDAIPAQHQEVILLSDVEELTYKEIAASLDIPIGTVM